MECIPTIAVHGGAGFWRTKKSFEKTRECLTEALNRGLTKTIEENAVEGVVEAIKVLEDCGEFNAGRGSVPNREGVVEMDAGIMDGWSNDAGGIGGIRGFRNPILIARDVMKKTNHIILIGEGAENFALEHKHEKFSFSIRKPEKPYRELKRYWILQDVGDTVGSVALDKNCRLAAGSSTGGLRGKLPGRLGDSAIPGAGFYANRFAAATATGIGEIMIIESLSRKAVEEASLHGDIRVGLETIVELVTKKYGKDLMGIIGIDINGRVHGAYNTQAMPWGYLREKAEKPVLRGFP